MASVPEIRPSTARQDLYRRMDRHNTFVVPSWMPLQLQASAETVLFSFSDRPGQEAMGLWREKKS